jgi:RND family efflux transporter MFP subunit
MTIGRKGHRFVFGIVVALVTLAWIPLVVAPGAHAEPAPRLAPIQLTPERRQLIGLRFATVEEQQLAGQIDATGTIEPDERLESYVQTRFAGWIKTVSANQTWAQVKRGEAMFTIYSPDLASAEDEYLLARNEQREVSGSAVPGVKDGASSIAAAALDRLRLFGVSPREVARLEREDTARDTVEIDAPASGAVAERMATPNLYAQPDMRLYTIANLSRVWVYAAVFQDDIGKVSIGDPVSVAIDAYPGQRFDGRVDFIWPEIDPATRTARVRCDFDNHSGILRPGMFVNVSLTPHLGRGLVIPDSGVLRTGVRDIAFLNKGDGYLQPVDVELGAHLGDHFQVLTGLRAGDEIVASANFLIDSESQLQAALGTFAPPPPGVGANGSSQLANAAEATASAATIDLTTEPSPPQRGSNVVRVALNDSAGKPIAGAEVSVVFFMPAMPEMGMAAMKAQATATEQTPGRYVGSIELQSGGTWQVTVVATKGGHQAASRELSVSATGGM